MTPETPGPFVAALPDFCAIFFSIYLASAGFLVPVTKGSPLLCSGSLICSLLREDLHRLGPLLASPLPCPQPSFTCCSLSHHFCLVSPETALILSGSLSLFPSSLSLSSPFAPLPSPPSTSRSLLAVSHFLQLFFSSPAFLSISVLKSVSIFFCGVIQSVISLQPVWGTSQGFSSPRTLERDKKRHEKSLRNAGSKLKDGERARLGTESVGEL